MLTYQDMLKEPNRNAFVRKAISIHRSSDMYKTAVTADHYDHKLNETILNYIRTIFTLSGSPVEDFTASNNKICSNFFHRLNTQRCTYLLGNGVSFSDNIVDVQQEDGTMAKEDTTKEFLGDRFDTDLKNLAYMALIHGVSFGFWNVDRLHVFPLTEFVPLWDEETGALRAGIRFWRIDAEKPMLAVLYEEDGYTKYKADDGLDLMPIQEKRAYRQTVRTTEADGEEVVGESNYSSLPVIPLWGSSLHQSTLVGMQSAIDSYDLIRSGFANDLTDCSQVYWILSNAGGMDDADLARFRDRLKINHIAVADTDNSAVTPYSQDIPFSARQAYLDSIRAGLYEDFGGLDVHTIAAGATNDHIDAAYQPLDEEADDFEFQIIEFIQQLLALNGISDMPVFKRNRISNQMEQVQMVMLEAEYLDDETILRKLPNITIDEVTEILKRKDADEIAQLGDIDAEPGTEGDGGDSGATGEANP